MSNCSAARRRQIPHAVLAALFMAMAALFLAGLARGADSPSPLSGPPRLMSTTYTQTDGEQLYEALCQACHMPGGTGATGAAAYPALMRDRHLAAKGFAIARVLEGSKAMPPFKELLTDAQIAAVVDHIRTHFGNAYKDKVQPADVKALRQ